MSKKPRKPTNNPDSKPEVGQFGLSKPSSEIEALRLEQLKASSPAASDDRQHYISTEKHLHEAEAKYKAMGWKGMEVEEVEVPEDTFTTPKKQIPQDDLDMTPMVDVTFLLLIFFMVTASFSLQKSIQQPPAKTDAPTTAVTEDIEVVDDYVEVIIDQNNIYYVTTRDEEEKEAPSEREMRSRLKDAKDNSTATRLIIKAHLDCKHSRVVTAWDAGIAVGMNQIEIQTTEQDF